ncbi:MAG TPA: hypothetical protein VGV07_19385 [Devosia sp.]|jgi:hypothetical protein|uniref:hypothetical protein n=1 Tax=Devosia sp. TaxID=1871048 RepID=UPI002DDD82E7|nr:hypothetical protein [Devosia sp.]HEV2517425.1 hypothetical protein [Devosia sp.]
MTKLALAATFAVAMLTSFSAIPANAQSPNNPTRSTVPTCTAQCGDQGGGGTPSDPDCGGQIGALKRVLPAQVLGVDDDYRVWVTEFCLSSSLMRSDGNAAYLRTAIADNDVLTEVLTRHGYEAEDVFAVKMMGDDTINLFVHDFGR